MAPALRTDAARREGTVDRCDEGDWWHPWHTDMDMEAGRWTEPGDPDMGGCSIGLWDESVHGISIRGVSRFVG